jgi:hypothetical protein
MQKMIPVMMNPEIFPRRILVTVIISANERRAEGMLAPQ